ncbi:protein cellulose synthase interactive 3 [Tanacetum coccineum]
MALITSSGIDSKALCGSGTSCICRMCNTIEVKKLMGESGCMPLLIGLLEAKSNGVREVAAQAVTSLMTHQHNRREVKKDEKSVPNLVKLLDPSPQNTAKIYVVSCLSLLSSSKRCRKLYGFLRSDRIDLNKEDTEQEDELESNGDDDLPEVADPDNVTQEIRDALQEFSNEDNKYARISSTLANKAGATDWVVDTYSKI